jgi:hypothetical protein
MFIDIVKRAQGLQSFVQRCLTAVPPAIEHHVGKTLAIKKAFYFAFFEKVAGDYVEFGTYQGNSMISAFHSNRSVSKSGTVPARKFWGFDSFEGFKVTESGDKHPYFEDGYFMSDHKKVQQRVARQYKGRAEFELVKGYFEDTVAGKTTVDFRIGKVAVALIDCDLGSPATLALDFLKPGLQNGTILIMDDYFAYRGSRNAGVAGAFERFKRENPKLEFRRLFDYGHGGQGFVLENGV